MKLLYSLIFLLSLSHVAAAQSFTAALYEEYDSYKEQQIQERRFSYADIKPLIEQIAADSQFEVRQVGQSIEGRPINLIRIGNGDTRVLLWSQMHGNESTATMALFDLFNFFRQDDDQFADEKQQLLEEVSLYFIPMLNPDGAQKFQRRNAIGIDINRDALRTVTPEGQTLKAVRDSLNPAFGFNLHDQSTYYTAGRNGNPATISFLAPAYDFEQSENEVRTRAMRLIGYMNDVLQKYIPNKVAKYSDEHEPRAFGDLIQKWGTSTILIESGGYPDDPEKQYIRKLNFVSILAAIEAIAEETYSNIPVEKYFQIPQNKYFLTDLLVRNATWTQEGSRFIMDFSIRHSDRMADEDSYTYYYQASINDLGDLSTYHGYTELDAEGMDVQPGKIYPDTLQNEEQVRQLDFARLLSQGYTDVVVEEAPVSPFLSDIPVNVVTRDGYENSFRLGATPNLILTQNEEVRYVIVNGFLYDVQDGSTEPIRNTLVIR